MSRLLLSLCVGRSTLAFVSKTASERGGSRLFSVSSAEVALGVSRVDTLQTLLSRHGAPGSVGCGDRDDLEPVFVSAGDESDTPELVSSLMGKDEYANLHPHLYPLARSKKTGNVVCALRRAYADDTSEWYENSANAPWPIVEAVVGGPGYRLLATNSENLMRRIACECDFSGENKDLVELYNDGVKKSSDSHEVGSVEKLG